MPLSGMVPDIRSTVLDAEPASGSDTRRSGVSGDFGRGPRPPLTRSFPDGVLRFRRSEFDRVQDDAVDVAEPDRHGVGRVVDGDLAEELVPEGGVVNLG